MNPTAIHELVFDRESKLFQRLGVEPVINASGIYTDLGGSILSPSIWKAMEELNSCFVRMTDLLDATGAKIARLTGAESARITPGASAALALAVGATMVGGDTERWGQLPDTTGLKNEALMSAYHAKRYKYAPCACASGARIQTDGPLDSYNPSTLMAAIGPRTACILVPAHLLDGFSGAEQLTTLCAAAHEKGIPVVVDAAYLSFPTSLITDLVASGADLICFSAKYFYGPNPGGFVAGRKDYVSVVEGLDFTRYESGRYKTFGRPYKMSRYDIAATALAFEDWFQMDHKARWESYRKRVQIMFDAVPNVPGMVKRKMYFTMDEQLLAGGQINCLVLEFNSTCRFSAKSVAKALEADTPLIIAIPEGDSLILAVDAMIDGHEQIVAERLSRVLG